MEKIIPAAEANRSFSRLLRKVKEGQSYIVTSHGRPVARIVPLNQSGSALNAKEVLLKRLKAERVQSIGRWKRDELYE